MTRLRALVLAPALLVAACSSDDTDGVGSTRSVSTAASSSVSTSVPTSTPSTSVSTVTPPPTSSAPSGNADAAALAQAGLPRAEDLPGFERTVDADDANSESDAKALADCLGRPVPVDQADEPGADFDKGEQEIEAEVDVVASADDAKADLAAFTEKAPACYEKLLRDGLAAGGGGKIDSLSIEPVQVAVPGADAASAFQISVTVSASGQSLTINGHLLAAVLDNVEIQLSSSTQGGPDQLFGTITTLMGTLVQRVSAAL